MSKHFFKLLFSLLFLCSYLSFSQKLSYPQTKKIEHVDTYFGTKISDPYQWMEDQNAQDVADWVKEENKVTFSYLDKIPFRNSIKERLTKIWNYPKYTVPFKEGNMWFSYKNNGLQNQSVLYVQKDLNAEPQLLLDPNTLSADGTVALSGTSVSKDGKYLAYSISRSGSDWQEIYVMNIETKTMLNDTINWAKFTGINWRGNGFYYSRFDAPKEEGKTFSASNEFHKIYFHKIGTKQSEDNLVYEDKEHAKRTFGFDITEDERFLFLTGSEGTSGNSLYYMDTKKGDTQFKPIVTTLDKDIDRKSTRLNSSHVSESRMPSSA